MHTTRDNPCLLRDILEFGYIQKDTQILNLEIVNTTKASFSILPQIIVHKLTNNFKTPRGKPYKKCIQNKRNDKKTTKKEKGDEKENIP